MTTLTDTNIGYGSLQFFKKVEPTPATSETKGNVTVNNMGSPGSPAYYQATFMLRAEHEAAGVKFSNIFHWTAVVPEKAIGSSYEEVEAEAARQIAPMLREIADAIEKQIVDPAESADGG